jgi:hypothetical protein
MKGNCGAGHPSGNTTSNFAQADASLGRFTESPRRKQVYIFIPQNSIAGTIRLLETI